MKKTEFLAQVQTAGGLASAREAERWAATATWRPCLTWVSPALRAWAQGA